MAGSLRSIFLLALIALLVFCSGFTRAQARKHLKRSRALGVRVLSEKKAADADIQTANEPDENINRTEQTRRDYTIVPGTTAPVTSTPTSPYSTAGTPPTTPTSPYSNAGTTPTAPVTTTPISGVQSWCVARSNVADKSLQVALDYACGLGGADCRAILKGGGCYDPDTVIAHASYAFNSYYQKNNMAPGTCDFGGNAIITTTNPSYGSCMYPLGSSNAGTTTTPSTGTGTGTTTPVTTYPGTTPPGSFATPGVATVPPPPGGMTSSTGGVTTPSTGFPGVSMGPNAGYNSPSYDTSASVCITAFLTSALSWLLVLVASATLC